MLGQTSALAAITSVTEAQIKVTRFMLGRTNSTFVGPWEGGREGVQRCPILLEPNFWKEKFPPRRPSEARGLSIY